VSRERSAESIRAFVALEIDAGARRRLAELIESLRPVIAGLRFVKAENLHLTLRFLGRSRPEPLARLARDLDRAAAACPPTAAPLGALGLFPPRGRPRILWLDVAFPQPILDLQEACERAAVVAGFAPEARAFRSHLTLGRFRAPARPPALPAVELGELLLERLVLFRSELRPQGPVYTPVEVFPLGRG
jgi:2'-5' RNA ligase